MTIEKRLRELISLQDDIAYLNGKIADGEIPSNVIITMKAKQRKRDDLLQRIVNDYRQLGGD